MSELYSFLAKLIERYTGGDSSSVPIELAEDLWRSADFLIKNGEGETLEARYGSGLAEMEKQIKVGLLLWQGAAGKLPPVPNQSMTDTLREVYGFFKLYNPRFFAHQIPCDMDYQLADPVDEGVLGVHYINEWLYRLIIENRLLSRFDFKELDCLLKAYIGDYEANIVNLYEPVVANLLARHALGLDLASLSLSPNHETALLNTFMPYWPSDLTTPIQQWASSAAKALRLSPESHADYFVQTALRMVPRIKSGLSEGQLDGVFQFVNQG